MRASFVVSEVLNGLRRNLTMTIAMILTTAVSLALLGEGLVVVRMIDNTQELYQDKLEVSVYLVEDISANDKACTGDPCKALQSDLDSDPAVESVAFENRDQAFERFKRLFESQPELLKLARPEALPASFHVKLKDPDRTEVITQAYNNRPGIDSIVDQSTFLTRFFSLFNTLRDITFLFALLAAIATLLLISNTVQVSAFTRRTEVGIMRLVGATRWYTQLPFLLEAVVAGVIGAILGIVIIAFVNTYFLANALSGLTSTGIIAAVGLLDALLVAPWLLLTAILISASTGYVTLRAYVRT
ncbi:MAG TPA: permease-like cell division protein FtsX [Actinophytocola sp.]|uniref:permease-like cell division protein FtsX n=1 Tax=Actinophytocola sp. TaxID=1872138 RepID=UPI002DBAE4E1|nr:permease-like cell division protein FtsX [Actinophytocola sp.]HEU5474885.1 permease-like cell division protein FtsX [Actinophytocola sp.]